MERSVGLVQRKILRETLNGLKTCLTFHCYQRGNFLKYFFHLSCMERSVKLLQRKMLRGTLNGLRTCLTFHCCQRGNLRNDRRHLPGTGAHDPFLPGPPITVDGFQAARVLGDAGPVPTPATPSARRSIRPGHVLRPAAFLFAARRRAPQTLARRLWQMNEND